MSSGCDRHGRPTPSTTRRVECLTQASRGGSAPLQKSSVCVCVCAGISLDALLELEWNLNGRMVGAGTAVSRCQSRRAVSIEAGGGRGEGRWRDGCGFIPCPCPAWPPFPLGSLAKAIPSIVPASCFCVARHSGQSGIDTQSGRGAAPDWLGDCGTCKAPAGRRDALAGVT